MNPMSGYAILLDIFKLHHKRNFRESEIDKISFKRINKMDLGLPLLIENHFERKK